jgi:5-methylcytosine-specific restriction endonuclease McrA
MTNRLNRLRYKAFKRQTGRCYYCGLAIWIKGPEEFAHRREISFKQAAQLQCTAEHLIARRDGGSDSPQNIVAACAYCNRRRHSQKSARSPEKHRTHVRARMARKRWHPAAVHEIGHQGGSISVTTTRCERVGARDLFGLAPDAGI